MCPPPPPHTGDRCGCSSPWLYRFFFILPPPLHIYSSKCKDAAVETCTGVTTLPRFPAETMAGQHWTLSTAHTPLSALERMNDCTHLHDLPSSLPSPHPLRGRLNQQHMAFSPPIDLFPTQPLILKSLSFTISCPFSSPFLLLHPSPPPPPPPPHTHTHSFVTLSLPSQRDFVFCSSWACFFTYFTSSSLDKDSSW